MKEAEVAEKFAQQRADAQGSLEEEETEEPFVPAEARVKELGNLLFRYDDVSAPKETYPCVFPSDGKKYMEAEYFNPPDMLPSMEYKRLWLLQEFHDDFFRKTKHRRYIPRLGETSF